MVDLAVAPYFHRIYCASRQPIPKEVYTRAAPIAPRRSHSVTLVHYIHGWPASKSARDNDVDADSGELDSNITAHLLPSKGISTALPSTHTQLSRCERHSETRDTGQTFKQRVFKLEKSQCHSTKSQHSWLRGPKSIIFYDQYQAVLTMALSRLSCWAKCKMQRWILQKYH